MLRNFGHAALTLALVCVAACGTTSAPERPTDPRAAERVGVGVQELARGDRAAARKAFEDAVDFAPLSVDAHRRLQNMRVENHEALELLREYRALFEAHPESADAAYLYGRLMFGSDLQKTWFEKTLELDRQHPWGLYGMAVIAEREGRRDAALEYVDRALARDPRNAIAHFLRGRLLYAAARIDEAAQEFEQAAELDPAMTDSLVYAASAAGAQGRLTRKWSALRSALERPRSETAIIAMGQLALEDNDPSADLALEALEGLPRNDGTAATALALAYEHRGDLARAESSARRALASGSYDRGIIFVLRRTLVRRGDIAAAVDQWLEYLGMNVNDAARPLRRLREVASGLPNDTVLRDWPIAARMNAAEALSAAGWHEEAYIVARPTTDDPTPAAADPATPPDDVLTRVHATTRMIAAHRRVLRSLALLMREIDGTTGHALEKDIDGFLDAVARVITEETGESVRPLEEILRFPFIGEMMSMEGPPKGGINDYFARFNQVALAGRLESGRVGLLVMTLVEDKKTVSVPGAAENLSTVLYRGADVVVRPEDELFREIGGRALYGCVYLDLDVLVPWRRQLMRRADVDLDAKRRLLESDGLEARNEAERRSIDYPLDTEIALILRALEDHPALPLEENVRIHELGHVVDTERYVPFWSNFFANLALAAEGGFSGKGIMSVLEENAHLHALRYGPAPHLILAELVRSLPEGGEPGPHALGYRRLLTRFIAALDRRIAEFPGIRSDRMLLHQLHRLDADQIKRIARDL